MTAEANNDMKIREIIVVEGRDDTTAVRRSVDAVTIETHGYGISAATWKLIDKAYHEKGIIVFTDPDHAGEQILWQILFFVPLQGRENRQLHGAHRSFTVRRRTSGRA